MSYTTATLDYFVNPSGTCTAAQLATKLQTAFGQINKTFILSMLGTSVGDFTGSVQGTQARLRVHIPLNATFAARFPATMSGPNNPSTGPFNNLFTAALRALVNSPVVAATPALS